MAMGVPEPIIIAIAKADTPVSSIVLGAIGLLLDLTPNTPEERDRSIRALESMCTEATQSEVPF